VQAAVRTNFYQTRSRRAAEITDRDQVASRKLELVPLPRPLSRSSSIRHGSRACTCASQSGAWRHPLSDRPQDFRTEILGLVKARNRSRTPVDRAGRAKGGFVPKLLPKGPREAVQAEGTAAYKLFISTLLDITTISATGISARHVVRMTRMILISWLPPTKAPRPSRHR